MRVIASVILFSVCFGGLQAKGGRGLGVFSKIKETLATLVTDEEDELWRFGGLFSIDIFKSYICNLPKELGNCTRSKTRWYYDQGEKKCVMFSYTGCKGNLNNFRSQDVCEERCGDVCILPKEVGICKANFPRWYYDQAQKQCVAFVYGGCQGNSNNFRSEGDCKEKCDVCSLPMEVGPCKAAFSRWYYNETEKKCMSFTFGGCHGNGNNFASEEACIGKCGDVCTLPMDDGCCKHDYNRWYYDQTVQECKQFIYGGCLGNANNFVTKAACVDECIDVCSLPQDTGACNSPQLRWYFNKGSQQCEIFLYNGCQGNGNRFLTAFECNKKCGS